MDFPSTYNYGEYVKWHHLQNPVDEDLPFKLDTLRNELAQSATKDLQLLNEVFRYFFDYAQSEYQVTKQERTKYEATDEVDFKKTSSIINKLWRNYKIKNTFIALTEIKSQITDLIRTEIVGDTLASCKFLAERFQIQHIHNPALRTRCEKEISKINFEPEMKMASGYFAYHILIYFTDGIIIEVQIYSSIVRKWRKLSHNLYEIVRSSPIDYDFGSKQSRLVSLGHLFHLAECEIERLQEEYNKQSPRPSS